MFEADIAAIRSALNSGTTPSTSLKEAVDAFDTVGRNCAEQLRSLVPMTGSRRTKWERANFAQLADVAEGLESDFDIDILRGIDGADYRHVQLMFHRRHLFTHRGGIADRKYLDESGDTTVELGQLVRETQENVHRLLSTLMRLASNLHEGYHALIPIHESPVKYHQEALARRKRAEQNGRPLGR